MRIACPVRKPHSSAARVKVRLAYGAGGLEVELPDERTTVVEPAYHAGAADEAAVLRDALRAPVAGPPLSELARPGHEGRDLDVRRHARPAARQDDPGGAGRARRARLRRRDPRRDRHAPRQHRRGDPGDARRRARRRACGSSTTTRATSDSLVFLGEHGRGVPVWINRLWVEADLRITTGFVEPHFFAGFSGGPKLVTPGLAGLDTVLVLHNADADRRSEGHLGRDRGQPGPRRHPRGVPPRRRRTSRST